MAEIKMDISEYEALKENKALLQASLEREKQLNSQIHQLNEARIKALEEAKMKVVKITKTEHTEYLLETESVYTAWEKIKELVMQYNSMSKSFMAIDARGMGLRCIEHLQHTLFKKTTAYSFPKEEITLHGLDEVKAEIEQDLKSKLDEEISHKLSKADETLALNMKLLQENSNLRNELSTEKEISTMLIKSKEELIENNKKLNEANDKYFNTIHRIKQLVVNGDGFWGKTITLAKIRNVLTEV